MIIRYNSETEIQGIIEEQKINGWVLKEVRNIAEGNFLLFDNNSILPVERINFLENEAAANTDYLIDIDFRLMMLELGIL